MGSKENKQKFMDMAYSKFGVKANGRITFEQAFLILDEIEKCQDYEQLKCDCKQPTFTRTVDENYNPVCGKCGKTL